MGKKQAGKAVARREAAALPATFKPAETRERVAKSDAIIRLAKQLKDWPLLETAVDAKIEEQAQFVVWWDANVSARKGGDRKSKDQKPRSEFLISRPDAEKQTEISQQQVSRWCKAITPDSRPKYREKLLASAWKWALSESPEPT